MNYDHSGHNYFSSKKFTDECCYDGTRIDRTLGLTSYLSFIKATVSSMIVKNIFWNWGFTSRQYALSELLKLST